MLNRGPRLFCGLYAQAGSLRLKMTAIMESPTATNALRAKELFDNGYVPVIDQASDILIAFTATADERAVLQEQSAAASVALAIVILAACGLAAVVLSLLMAAIIRKSILTPVNEIVSVFEEMSKGNMKVEIAYQGRDELGRMAELIGRTNAMQGAILINMTDKLLKLSQRDLGVQMDMEYPGDFAAFRQTIEDTVLNLHNTMLHIHTAAEQVATGPGQGSGGEQTAAIEQIKDGLSQISTVVQTNAATAEENSATSEEMSAQAATLREEVSKFKLTGNAAHAPGAALSFLRERPSGKLAPQPAFSLGKY